MVVKMSKLSASNDIMDLQSKCNQQKAGTLQKRQQKRSHSYKRSKLDNEVQIIGQLSYKSYAERHSK